MPFLPHPALIPVFTLLAGAVFVLQYVFFGMTVLSGFRRQFSAAGFVLISTIFSLSLQALMYFFGGLFIGPSIYWLGLVFLTAGVWKIRSHTDTLRLLVTQLQGHRWLAAWAIFGALSLASTLMLTWLPSARGLQLQSGQLHDSAWHIALINQLTAAIPPEHPSNYQLTVQNYHYFYDVIVAQLSSVYRLPISVAYFQVFPLVFALLLSASMVALAKAVHSIKAAWWSVFFTFFVGSLGYMVPWFIPGQVGHESSFWVSQTFAMMVNPQMIFSLATLAWVGWLLVREPQFAKHRWWLHGMMLVTMAAAIGFKSYGWMVLGSFYLPFAVLRWWQSKDWRYLGLVGGFVLCSLPVVALITGFKTSSFFWFPLWYLTSMVESADRLNLPQLRLQEDALRAQGSLLGVLKIRLIELVLFVIGNLGTRVLAIGAGVWWWRQRRHLNQSYWNVSWLVALLFSASFPLLFLQQGAVWNSIQFWYYTLIMTGLLASITMAELFERVKSKKAIMVGLGGLVVALSLPTYWQVQKLKLGSYDYIQVAHLELLATLQASDRVLICPTGTEYYKTALVSALTASSQYGSDPDQLAITNSDTSMQERLQEAFKADDGKALTALTQEHGFTHVLCDQTQWYDRVNNLNGKPNIGEKNFYLKSLSRE